VDHIKGTDELTLSLTATTVQFSSFHQNLNEEAGKRYVVVPH